MTDQILDQVLLPLITQNQQSHYPQSVINILAPLEDIYNQQSVQKQIQINQAGDYRDYIFPLIFEQLIVSQNHERDFDFVVNVYSKIHPQFLRVNQYDLLTQFPISLSSFTHLDGTEIPVNLGDNPQAGQIITLPQLGIMRPDRSQGHLYLWLISEGTEITWDPILLDILNYGDQMNYQKVKEWGNNKEKEIESETKTETETETETELENDTENNTK